MDYPSLSHFMHFFILFFVLVFLYFHFFILFFSLSSLQKIAHSTDATADVELPAFTNQGKAPRSSVDVPLSPASH
jgi:hypothetical protein